MSQMSKFQSTISTNNIEKADLEWTPELRVESEYVPAYQMKLTKMGGGLNVVGHLNDSFSLVLGAGLSYVQSGVEFDLFRDPSGFCELRDSEHLKMGLDFSPCPGFRERWLDSGRQIENYSFELNFKGIAAFLKLGTEINFYSHNNLGLAVPIHFIHEVGQVSADEIDYTFPFASTSLESGLKINVTGKTFDLREAVLFNFGQTHWADENLFRLGIGVEVAFTPHLRKIKTLSQMEN